ncbi:hypothetical protein L596_001813 [Steinernema carpocapsae]|uniref:Uncharacterized protein n=1 Tax=Steinernema carpocapsae TaxID=34508 RepID=A0A4U8UMB6_STECR|nr:hypothetical protein L596_001813 [Steinernema carpocapsae]
MDLRRRLHLPLSCFSVCCCLLLLQYNQVLATIDELRDKSSKIGMLWMDIEVFAWPADHAYNRQVIRDMIKAAVVKALANTIGQNVKSTQTTTTGS